MYLPTGYIKSNGGVWIILDKSTPGSSKSVLNNATRRKSIVAQIDKMLATKYTFIHYNGVTKDFIRKLTVDYTINPFDNAELSSPPP
jgi:predicted type IV restriction endonuclease